MEKNIIALIVLYNIKIHHWLKCSNKTWLNRSAVLSNFANKKWKTRYPCPHLSTILDKIKWNRKPPSPPNQGWSCAKGKKPRHFPILDLGGGGRGGLGFPFILSNIVAEVPTPDGFLRSEHQNGRHRNVIYESFSSWFCLPLCDLIKATRSCY